MDYQARVCASDSDKFIEVSPLKCFLQYCCDQRQSTVACSCFGVCLCRCRLVCFYSQRCSRGSYVQAQSVFLTSHGGTEKLVVERKDWL